MSFADRRRSSGAFIEGRKLSIHSGESFRSHAGELQRERAVKVTVPRQDHKAQQLKITFENELQFMHNFIVSVPTFAS